MLFKRSRPFQPRWLPVSFGLLLSFTPAAWGGVRDETPHELEDIYTWRAYRALIWDFGDEKNPDNPRFITDQFKITLNDRLQTLEHRYLAASVIAFDAYFQGNYPHMHALCLSYPPKDDDYAYGNVCLYAQNLDTDQRIEKIKELGERAFRTLPKNMAGSSIFTNLGYYVSGLGRTNEGLRSFKRSLEMIPPNAEKEISEAKLNLAVAYSNPMLSERLRKLSIVYYAEAIQWLRGQDDVYYKNQALMANYNLGIAYLLSMQDPVSAIGAFKEALGSEILKIDARVFLAFSYAQSGQRKAARETLQSVRIDDKIDAARGAFLRCYRDLTYQLLGDKVSIRSCLDLNQPQIDVLLHLTETLSHQQLDPADENKWWRMFYRAFRENLQPDVQRTIESVSSEAELVQARAESRFKDLKLQNLSLYQYLVAALGGLAVLLSVAAIIVWKARTEAQAHAAILNRERARLQNILDSIEEGIFLIQADLSMKAEESKHLKKILGDKYQDCMHLKDFLRLSTLSADLQSTMLSCIQAVMGESALAWELNQGNLETHIKLDESYLTLYWQPVYIEDSLQAIFLALRDVTDLHLLEEAHARAQQDADKVLLYVKQIVTGNTQAVLHFLSDLTGMLAKTEQGIKRSDYPAAMRVTHTIKGSARGMGLGELREAAHVLEDHLQKGHETLIHAAFAQMASVCRQYQSALQFVTEEKAQHRNLDAFQIVSNLRGGIESHLRDAGLELGEIQLRESGRLSPAEYEKLSEILLHGLTNAMDHGFIIPARSGRAVQPPEFVIEIKADQRQRTLRIWDNGVGIQHGALRSMAESRGWKPQPGGHWTDFLFTDGVTTADTVTVSSGRGVGLAAIKQVTQALQGSVHLLDNENRQGALLEVSWNTPREEFPDLGDGSIRKLAL